MGDPSFGAKCAAEIRAELGLLDDDQERFVANLIDRHHATSQGRLDGFALEATSPIKHGSRKHREELFDAICGACEIPRPGMTKPMARDITAALHSIILVMPTLTTNEIILRAREYRRKHPTWTLTPFSLAKYWNTCASKDSARGLLDEPPGWRARHQEIFPEAESGSTGWYFSTQPWEKIGRAYQEKIIRFMSQAPERTANLPHAD